MRLHPAARADADQRLRVIGCNQLVCVDRQGRHPHARALDGYAVPAPRACESQHTAHFIDQFNPFKECLGGPAGAVGIARHEDSWGDLIWGGANMNGHGGNSF